MKVSEINRFIIKHLKESLIEYHVEKGMIFKVENDFFLKGYDFESTGNGEYDLAVWCFIQPLFVKSNSLYYNFGKRLKYKKKINIFKSNECEWWDASKEKLDESFQSILAVIKKDGEKYLNSVKTAREFYVKFNKKSKIDIRICEALTYSTILFDEFFVQEKMLQNLIEEAKKEMDIPWICQIRNDAESLFKIKNTQERVRLLKQWSNETIGNLKLSKLDSFCF